MTGGRPTLDLLEFCFPHKQWAPYPFAFFLRRVGRRIVLTLHSASVSLHTLGEPSSSGQVAFPICLEPFDNIAI
jgi:hypothetical protein